MKRTRGLFAATAVLALLAASFAMGMVFHRSEAHEVRHALFCYSTLTRLRQDAQIYDGGGNATTRELTQRRWEMDAIYAGPGSVSACGVEPSVTSTCWSGRDWGCMANDMRRLSRALEEAGHSREAAGL